MRAQLRLLLSIGILATVPGTAVAGESILAGAGGMVGLNPDATGGLSFRAARNGREGALGFEAGLGLSFGIEGERALSGWSAGAFFGLRYHFAERGAWSPYLKVAPEVAIILPQDRFWHLGPAVRLGGGLWYQLSSAVQVGADANVRLGGTLNAAGDPIWHAAVEVLPQVIVTFGAGAAQ